MVVVVQVMRATKKVWKVINTKKIIYLIVLILSISLVTAHHVKHDEIDYNEVKQLIDSNINCDKLTNEQLEEMGEYYMEQMHPGKEHNMMADMMGLHESDKIHDDFHVKLAKAFYCGDNKYMPMMMGSGGMMSIDTNSVMNHGGMNMMGSNMMGSYGNFGWFWMLTGLVFWIVLIVVLILLAIWLYKNIKKR